MSIFVHKGTMTNAMFIRSQERSFSEGVTHLHKPLFFREIGEIFNRMQNASGMLKSHHKVLFSVSVGENTMNLINGVYERKNRNVEIFTPGRNSQELKLCSQVRQTVVDPIYGTVKVSERIAALLASPLLRRLKGVHQNGSNYLIDPRQNTSRYEHSVGAMILTQKLGGDEPEQVAALLHDISHTAFSHIADLVFANNEQNYHDLVRTKFFELEIARKVIQEFAITQKELSCESIPMIKGKALNVDRLDYCLRDLAKVGRMHYSERSSILNGLGLDSDGEIKCKDLRVARCIFAKFIEVNKKVYFYPKAEVAAVVLSSILRQMLKRGDLSEEDFFGTDEDVIGKIKSSPFKDAFAGISSKIQFAWAIESLGCFPVHRKLRFIDPKIFGFDGTLTDHCKESRELLHSYLKTSTSEYYRIPLLDHKEGGPGYLPYVPE